VYVIIGDKKNCFKKFDNRETSKRIKHIADKVCHLKLIRLMNC